MRLKSLKYSEFKKSPRAWVTFTTLGFGDVTPLNRAGEIWVTAEVILGYLMLGLLISIMANKIAGFFSFFVFSNLHMLTQILTKL